MVLTTYQVIVRYIFNSPSTWSEELVGYLFGWSTMLGATIVSGERGHMNIPVLVDRFNPTMRKMCIRDSVHTLLHFLDAADFVFLQENQRPGHLF